MEIKFLSRLETGIGIIPKSRKYISSPKIFRPLKPAEISTAA